MTTLELFQGYSVGVESPTCSVDDCARQPYISGVCKRCCDRAWYAAATAAIGAESRGI